MHQGFPFPAVYIPACGGTVPPLRGGLHSFWERYIQKKANGLVLLYLKWQFNFFQDFLTIAIKRSADSPITVSMTHGTQTTSAKSVSGSYDEETNTITFTYMSDTYTLSLSGSTMVLTGDEKGWFDTYVTFYKE